MFLRRRKEKRGALHLIANIRLNSSTICPADLSTISVAAAAAGPLFQLLVAAPEYTHYFFSAFRRFDLVRSAQR